MQALNPVNYEDDDLYSGYNEFHPSLDTSVSICRLILETEM